MTIQTRGADALARRAHAEALLADYPHIDADELALLVRYFRREANALDVGMIASNDEIAQGYARFRKDYIDRFTWGDAARGLAGAAAIVLCVGLILLRAW